MKDVLFVGSWRGQSRGNRDPSLSTVNEVHGGSPAGYVRTLGERRTESEKMRERDKERKRRVPVSLLRLYTPYPADGYTRACTRKITSSPEQCVSADDRCPNSIYLCQD